VTTPSRNTADLISVVLRWAELREDVLGLAVVGSHARGDARPDSDVDVVLVCREPSRLLVDTAWVYAFGEAHEVRREDWGLVQSVRVVYQDGPVWCHRNRMDRNTARWRHGSCRQRRMFDTPRPRRQPQSTEGVRPRVWIALETTFDSG